VVNHHLGVIPICGHNQVEPSLGFAELAALCPKGMALEFAVYFNPTISHTV
jgi:hypothetical protein